MEDNYSTRNLYLASFLLLNGIELKGLEPKGKIVYFLFDSSALTQNLALDFFRRKSQVEPTRFIDNIKNLRILIRDILDENGFNRKTKSNSY